MKRDALILVTRSGDDGARLCRALQAHDFRARHFAPVRLDGPEDPERCRRELLSALPCDRLIVPSAEALRQAAALVGVEPLAGIALIVPGAGTARIARALGFTNVSHPASGGTSEQILRLPCLREADGLRVLVLAAAGGREALGRELDRRGATVQRLHVYRRLRQPIPSKLQAELLGCPEVITLLASGGALAALEAALGPAAWTHLASGLMIAPSPRVATLARAAGGDQVELADGADDASMLRALARARSDLQVCVTLES
ncbi:uroporphyrinogen-III synthase [Wenzhouxiangella limi]|uniref:Uroporphyrinogen-III synthase n=1 Tax=Wenzhouxiangella limi TaxID=2707351 RepID=A0A845UZG5_9GAMM|nr:uroporphyrinogen-III synthase [Wenzhouxiangella limi]NDY94456.1 uroporphyrinogen-III synthase [Wenzhouxiangella limi]